MMHGGQHIDLLIGLISASSCAALIAMLAFSKHAIRYFIQAVRLHATYADQLCAGVFVTAMGSLFSGLAVLVRFVTRHTFVPFYIAGWAMMGIGFFFVFCAWHGTLLGRYVWFRWLLGLLLLLIAVSASLIFRIAPNS